MAEALTPPPPGWEWGQLADEIFEGPPDWAAVRDRPDWTAYADDLEAYADRSPDAAGRRTPWCTWTAGTTT